MNRLAAQEALALDDAVDDRVRQSIERVLARQDSNGSFGLWSVGGDDPWLDAYVTDFLTRARERGFSVPQTAFNLALDRLRNVVVNTTDIDQKAGDIAYAVYVLARLARVPRETRDPRIRADRRKGRDVVVVHRVLVRLHGDVDAGVDVADVLGGNAWIVGTVGTPVVGAHDYRAVRTGCHGRLELVGTVIDGGGVVDRDRVGKRKRAVGCIRQLDVHRPGGSIVVLEGNVGVPCVSRAGDEVDEDPVAEIAVHEVPGVPVRESHLRPG